MLEKIYCYECGRDLQNHDDIYYIGYDEYVCESCRNRYYVYCDDCENLIYYDDALRVYRGDEDGLICPDCANTYYCVCGDCNELYHTDDVEYIDGECYCTNCINGHRDYIWSYSHKPYPVFYGGDDAGYGVELEIDDGHDKQEAAWDISEAGGDHVYLKEDGSLSYMGIEIVTHPATLEYHVNHFPWGDICDAALSHEYRSHDTDTCGLHIHASRELFGDTEIEQDLTIAKIMLLVDRWYDTHIVRFARRDLSKMRQWANKPNADIRRSDDALSAIQKSKDSSRGNKYKAINLCNRHTVEFRFFRGTLRRDTIIASIQWVDTIIQYCRNTPLKDLFNAPWDDIFGNTDHVELTEYLKRRNLYNLKKDVI